MKITKETKIGDIIPEGWEIREDLICGIAGTKERVPRLQIPIKKKEEKNFEWYYTKYLQYENYLDNNAGNNILGFLVNKNYEDIVFEFKIGLLKFICNDNDINVFDVINNVYVDKPYIRKIKDICPKEFLESITGN